jgi:hypothetical protein
VLAIFTALLAVVPIQVSPATRYEQVTITRDNIVPGVDLGTYTLITGNITADRREAEAIMDVKVAWPRAMRTKDEALFKRILSDAFTFRAHGRLYERDAYIRDRMSRQERVEAAGYANVVLQVFGTMALLTYNVSLVTNPGGTRETWHGTWADVFVRYRGRWQVRTSHLISERVEKESP